MTETSQATCATCPWWAKAVSGDEEWGECRHVSQMDADADPPTRGRRFWCSEHPTLQRERERLKVAAVLMAARLESDSWEEDAKRALARAQVLLAEAERRRGE